MDTVALAREIDSLLRPQANAKVGEHGQTSPA
jgi:hypothetical protein